MKNTNDLIIHCPNCNSYFPNKAYKSCYCKKCQFTFCFGCNKHDCESEFCIKFLAIIIRFYGLKGYGDATIFVKIIRYFAMLFQVLFILPLFLMYKMGPTVADINGFGSRENYNNYRKKGLIFCLIMIPYQIAFFGFWFYFAALLFFIPGIFYPPYTVYWIGLFRYYQTHSHGGTMYEGDGHFYE